MRRTIAGTVLGKNGAFFAEVRLMSHFTSIDYLYALLFAIALIGGMVAVLIRITKGKRRNINEMINEQRDSPSLGSPGLVTKKPMAQSEIDRKFK